MIKLEIYHHSSPSIRNYDPGKKGLSTLLRCSTELKELTFSQEAFSYLPRNVPYFLSFKLEAIEISGFESKKDCIEKAKYVLKNAGVLVKLTIRAKSVLDETDKLEIIEELVASPRKSKQCCILII